MTCFVGHDIRSLALAEHYFGASQDCEDSILVRVHRGTGAGIISNGRILLAATATSVKLAIFRSNRWVNAATAATLAAGNYRCQRRY